MSIHFEQEVESLKQKLVAMATDAAAMAAQAMQAWAQRDDPLAEQVKRRDQVLDQYEMQIDEAAMDLLIKAPLAGHLRLIAVALKISHELERVGDESTSIARRVLQLNRDPELRYDLELRRMAELALRMLSDVTRGLVDRDPVGARTVIPRDKEVDALNRAIQEQLVGLMKQSPDNITRALHLIMISKSLERIADHATNVAEEVVFLCEALDIRHNPFIKGLPA